MKELRQFVKGGGGRPFILKIRFCAMGWGDGLDMYQQLLGGFGSMRAILPMRGLTCGWMSKSYMPIQSWGKSGVLSYFFSYASHGQYCAHGPKTTIKLMVRVHAITPNPWVKIMFERPERATANKYTK